MLQSILNYSQLKQRKEDLGVIDKEKIAIVGKRHMIIFM